MDVNESWERCEQMCVCVHAHVSGFVHDMEQAVVHWVVLPEGLWKAISTEIFKNWFRKEST